MFVFDKAEEVNSENGRVCGLLEYAAQLIGPLLDYHPQLVLQCLYWGLHLYHMGRFEC